MKRLLVLLILALFSTALWQCADDDTVLPDPEPDETDTTDNDTLDPVELTPYDFPDIAHFSDFPHDPANPVTVEGVELGRKLYFDPILSSNFTIACADCHKQVFSFGDNQSVSGGVDNVPGTRNSPPLVNLAWFSAFNWDGRETKVRDQNIHPVPSVIEMNLPWPEAEQRIRNHEDYPALFEVAFPDQPITRATITRALEQFQLTMLSYDSPYDRHLRGAGSLSDAELRGLAIFTGPKGSCFRCHDVENSPELFVTDRIVFTNNGLDTAATLNDFTDPGRGPRSGNINDNGKFRIPTLRNLAFTAPYMHDGRFSTLREVIDTYDRGPAPSPNVDPLMLADAQFRLNNFGHWGLNLSDAEKDDLEAFLLTMSEVEYLSNPDYFEP